MRCQRIKLQLVVVFFTLVSGWLSSRDLLDCEADPEWVSFRVKLAENAEEGFPLDSELILQAQSLLQTHQHHLTPDPAAIYGMSTGMQSFFLNCNQPPNVAESLPPPFCLYGAIAALWVLARFGGDKTLLTHARFLLGAAMRHSLDFMDSSTWAVSSIDVLANLQRPHEPFRLPKELHAVYKTPQVDLFLSKLDLPSEPVEIFPKAASLRQLPSRLVVWEVGVHASLSAEPLHMWARALQGTEIAHRNLIQDQYPEWLPDKCDTLYSHARLSCDTTHDDITQVFQHFIPFSATSNEPIESIDALSSAFLQVAGSRIHGVDIFLCTIGYLCLLAENLALPVVGYFGHPLLFMVPRNEEARNSFWSRFVALAKKDSVEFACDGPFLQMQSDYQVGSPRLTVIRTHALYTGATHVPVRGNEVLVLDRPHEAVLMCILQRFLPNRENLDAPAWLLGDGRLKMASSSDYPYTFITRGMTDKKFSTFAQFRAVVLWPYDMDLVTFYEFYGMSMPIFMPSHISKYIFEQNHMWYHGQWLGAHRNAPSLWPMESGQSPFNETSLDAVWRTIEFADYFRFPHVQYFASIPDLLEQLPTMDFFAVVQAMTRFNQDSLIASTISWRAVLWQVMDKNLRPT